MSKRDATFALAAHNERNGDDIHCWCEGGDATDDFTVPDHLSDEADRIVAKRMAEIEALRSRRLFQDPALG